MTFPVLGDAGSDNPPTAIYPDDLEECEHV
jgi:hypothetical protein